MLHDVGKLGVPTRVLQKSGGLTEEEFAAIQRHPMQGLEIVREIEFLDEANAGIMHHHERIDGLGYPMGLAGDRDPGVRPGDRGRRRLRLDDHDALLPRRAHARGGCRRAAALRRHPVRPRHGRGTGARPGRARLGPGGGARVHRAGAGRGVRPGSARVSTTTTRPARWSRSSHDVDPAPAGRRRHHGIRRRRRVGSAARRSSPWWPPLRPAGSSTLALRSPSARSSRSAS